ncbi:hypothetical protein GGR50DRAFT_130535 [Xylaria sp. CBS 124048]|nr:hypothetical protein GGR50DRAFT_130535 [Xylaria sp. CBS 124048]
MLVNGGRINEYTYDDAKIFYIIFFWYVFQIMMSGLWMLKKSESYCYCSGIGRTGDDIDMYICREMSPRDKSNSARCRHPVSTMAVRLVFVGVKGKGKGKRKVEGSERGGGCHNHRVLRVSTSVSEKDSMDVVSKGHEAPVPGQSSQSYKAM